MGGSANGRGNVTRTAEFNVKADPEAAAVVFAEPWKVGQVTVASWDLCREYNVPWTVFDGLIKRHEFPAPPEPESLRVGSDISTAENTPQPTQTCQSRNTGQPSLTSLTSQVGQAGQSGVAGVTVVATAPVSAVSGKAFVGTPQPRTGSKRKMSVGAPSVEKAVGLMQEASVEKYVDILYWLCLFRCLEGFISVLLLSCSITNVGSPILLLSCNIMTIPLHIIIIPIMTSTSTTLQCSQLLRHHREQPALASGSVPAQHLLAFVCQAARPGANNNRGIGHFNHFNHFYRSRDSPLRRGDRGNESKTRPPAQRQCIELVSVSVTITVTSYRNE